MGTQKPLIVPWLIEQLDNQRYPGVSWLNSEKTLFRVPWKHASRQSINPKDFQIFEDWAIARHLYNPETDPRTPSEWKRNFRSALNRKDGIEMVEDNSTDPEDPHKVYEINFNIANLNNPAVEVIHAPLIPAESRKSKGISSLFSQDETQKNMLSSMDRSNFDNALEDYPMWYQLNPADSTTPMTLLEQTERTSEFGMAAENRIGCGSSPSSNLGLYSPIAMNSQLEQLITTPFETDFEVRTFYRGRQVLHEVINKVNNQGLCFVPPGVHGNYLDLADVSLPDPTILNDKLQADYTLRLLKGVAPGVLLRITGNQLCGMRKGVCHVYWSQSEIPGDGAQHGNLLKEQFTPIFNLQLFVSDLIGYIEGRNGCPNYTWWLCFGEEWPDSNCVWKKKLIIVQVIPKVLETLCELGKSHGASSLNGNEPDLRISDSLQHQQLLEQLRKWEEKMDIV
ncbi:interferon regulatory factor 3 [Pantherophis guttatus]|uniref:Interferon regulatory factor 3 n=1 Tax=Pantherophis guttatus TaxID=94885 RepID=A0A6P9BTQ1_PANGU|nr:interferon regulatory factor 3 [Pantherophis guttatus]XP_034271281.1 interferon regulatory factor 3 [Pantherophis guttatus]